MWKVKSHFFQKSRKNQNFEIPWRTEKKQFRKKVLLRSSYIHWENLNSRTRGEHYLGLPLPGAAKSAVGSGRRPIDGFLSQ
jgi:hypothetical protein